MSLHTGKIYKNEGVSLGPANIDLARKNNPINYADREWEKWREKARIDNDVYYFSIYNNSSLVGEIFLHDIDKEKAEALLGYHIFDPNLRGKGIGTKALQLLQEHVKQTKEIKKLIIITAENNLPSRKISEKCGFVYTGPAWEDPKMVVYEWSNL